MTEFLIDSKSKGFTNNEGCNLLCSNNIDNNGNHGDSDTSSANEEVRTIFVSGLPMDAKQRELYLLFRSFKGFQTATLKPPGKNGKPTAPVGFVTFETRNQAEHAIEQLEGIKFDPDSDQLMRLEFARTNTKMLKNKMYNSHVYNSGFNQQLPGSVDTNLLNSEMNLFLGYDGRLAFFAQSAFSPFGPALLPFNGSTFRPSGCTFAPIAVSTPNGILYGNNVKLPNTPMAQGPPQSNQTISPFMGPQTGLLGETISQVLMHPNQNGFLYVQPFTIDLNEMNAQPLESQIRMNSWNSNAE